MALEQSRVLSVVHVPVPMCCLLLCVCFWMLAPSTTPLLSSTYVCMRRVFKASSCRFVVLQRYNDHRHSSNHPVMSGIVYLANESSVVSIPLADQRKRSLLPTRKLTVATLAGPSDRLSSAPNNRDMFVIDNNTHTHTHRSIYTQIIL